MPFLSALPPLTKSRSPPMRTIRVAQHFFTCTSSSTLCLYQGMTQPQINKSLKRNHVTDRLINMDWFGLRAYLETLSDDVINTSKICNWIIRAENIVCKHTNKKRETNRGQLLLNLEQYLGKRLNANDSQKVSSLRDLIREIETGYRAIWAARLTRGIETLSPEQRVSGAFWTAHSIVSRIEKLTNAYFEAGGIVSNAMIITDENGKPLNPDAEITAICQVATMTCLGEGFANQWFDNDGVLVLPSLPKLTTPEQGLSELASMNALFWRNWEAIDEHRRFLGGMVKHFEAPNLPEWASAQSYTNAAEYRLPDDKIERFDLIANDRWKRQIIQNAIEISSRTKLSNQAKGLGAPLAIGTGLFVSEEEGLTLITLCETLYHDVSNDMRRYRGLRLAEWTRGYAVLQQYANDQYDAESIDSLFPQMSEEDWVDLLTRFGFTATQATQFIGHVLFKKTSRDLYDCPLVKLSNGNLVLFGVSLRGANLSQIMLSALSRMETVFEDKGPDFETYILNFLNKQPGVRAETKAVKKNGKDYQFDILMLFDGTVFMFELKNKTLSSGVAQRIYYGFKSVKDDVKQTERLAQALDNYPEILNELFGEGTSDLPRIDSLLYARPYSWPGGINDITIFDAQSLRRFFTSRHFNVTALHKVGNSKTEMPVPIKDFWEKDMPSADALIKQILCPFQVDLAWENLKIGHVFSQLGHDKVCVREEHQCAQMTPESVATHFGADIKAIMETHFKLEEDITRMRTKQADTTPNKGSVSKSPQHKT